MDINCWQFLNLAWSIGVTGDHTWQLQMTARRPSSTVMFLGTSGHDMVNIRSVDYVYRYKNIATDMSWYECLELIGLGTGTVAVHSEIHYKFNKKYGRKNQHLTALAFTWLNHVHFQHKLNLSYQFYDCYWINLHSCMLTNYPTVTPYYHNYILICSLWILLHFINVSHSHAISGPRTRKTTIFF